jgi:hypothetical protein
MSRSTGSVDDRSMRSTRTVLAATSLAALLVTGCGAAAEKASEKLTEEAIESQTGGNVDIDASGDGSVEIETEDGSMSFGTGEVPADWPEDIPLPDELVVQSGSTSAAADGDLVAIIGTSSDTPEDLLATYKDALADWTISGEVTTTANDGSSTSAQWEIDGRRFTFVATSGGPTAQEETYLTLGHTTLS